MHRWFPDASIRLKFVMTSDSGIWHVLARPWSKKENQFITLNNRYHINSQVRYLTVFPEWWITSNLLLFVRCFLLHSKLENDFRCVGMEHDPTVAGPGDDPRSLGTKQVQATKAWELVKIDENVWIFRVGGWHLSAKSKGDEDLRWGPLGSDGLRYYNAFGLRWSTWRVVINRATFNQHSSRCEAWFPFEVVHILTVFLSFIFPKARRCRRGPNGGPQLCTGAGTEEFRKFHESAWPSV